MANSKLSLLTDGGDLLVSDNVPIERSGSNYRAQLPQNIRTTDSPTFAGVTISGGGEIDGLPAIPVGATSAISKAFFDSQSVKGALTKPNVDVATTANVTLSGEQTIDGVLTSTSRILVKDQTDPTENGIYVTASGAWARAVDLDNSPSSEIFNGVWTTIDGGTVNDGRSYRITSTGTGTDNVHTVTTDDIDWGVTDINFVAGTGITKVGATISTSSAQTHVTSLGTLTTLTVDDITVNGNAITSSGASSLTITALAGQAVAIEGVSFDGGVITGVSALTATALTGTLQTPAQANITSVGTLTSLDVSGNANFEANVIVNSDVDSNHYLSVGSADSMEVHGKNWVRLYTGDGANNAALYARGTGAAVYLPQYTTNGTVSTTGGSGLLSVSSDIRLKNIIKDSPYGLKEVLKMRPVIYEMKDNLGKLRLGFIANWLEKHLPEAIDGKKHEYIWEVNEDGSPKTDKNGKLIYKKDENGNKIPRYRGFEDRAVLASVVGAIQDLDSKIEAIKKQKAVT